MGGCSNSEKSIGLDTKTAAGRQTRRRSCTPEGTDEFAAYKQVATFRILAGFNFEEGGHYMKTLLSAVIGMSLALSALGQMQQNEETTAPTVRKGAKAHVEEKANVQSRAIHRPMMNERVKSRANANVRTKANVHVNVNDRTRFTNVTRTTSSGRTFNRAVFRDRNDWHFHLGFHDRIFFINRFSEVILINGCSFFLDEGIFWPAFIIGESCVPAPNVVFVAVG